MGSMPRLKIKDVNRYRKGSTNESRNCRHCESFRPDLLSDGERGVGKYSMRYPGRCIIIGQNPGIRYRVWSDHTCDRQKSTYKAPAMKRELVPADPEPEDGPVCPKCGTEMVWEECWNCGGEGVSGHDCGEDCCCCAYPEDNVRCDICEGKGGYYLCPNRKNHKGGDHV
ncbi:MAG: hypothetical protein LLG97_19525 [Deltaproteobacteria bacterium]|nr:hypothetical protein [Deltaproteobacteria bacterium]